MDVVVHDKYVFELKISDNRTVPRNFSAQLEEYIKEYPNVYTIILDNIELNLRVIDEYIV